MGIQLDPCWRLCSVLVRTKAKERIPQSLESKPIPKINSQYRAFAFYSVLCVPETSLIGPFPKRLRLPLEDARVSTPCAIPSDTFWLFCFTADNTFTDSNYETKRRRGSAVAQGGKKLICNGARLVYLIRY